MYSPDFSNPCKRNGHSFPPWTGTSIVTSGCTRIRNPRAKVSSPTKVSRSLGVLAFLGTRHVLNGKNELAQRELGAILGSLDGVPFVDTCALASKLIEPPQKILVRQHFHHSD